MQAVVHLGGCMQVGALAAELPHQLLGYVAINETAAHRAAGTGRLLRLPQAQVGDQQCLRRHRHHTSLQGSCAVSRSRPPVADAGCMRA
jgi:hypothetical protein